MSQQENLMRILRIIENEMGVSESEMTSKSRLRDNVWARYIFSQIANEYLYWTDRQIYSFLNIDRTSLLHCNFKHRQFLDNDKEYTHIYKKIYSVVADEISTMPKATPMTPKQIANVRMLNKRMLIGLEPVESIC